MDIITFGVDALLVNFENRIDPEINARVFHLFHYLQRKKIEGILSLVPSYCSLMVTFDREKWNAADLIERLSRFATKLDDNVERPAGKSWNIPVCYDLEFGLDLELIASEKNIAVPEVVHIHQQSLYQVFVVGFLPGFPYMGILPEKLRMSRKRIPRKKVPAGSVAMAGGQTGIYPFASPGGWQIIGRTPVMLFDFMREEPSLLCVGDVVKFEAINKEQMKYWQTLTYEEVLDQIT